MLGSPFKPRAHYVYDYKPRYYDPRKERLENLKKKYSESGEEGEIPRITISRDTLKQDWARHKKSVSDKSSNIRLAVIIAILVGIAAYVFELHKLF